MTRPASDVLSLTLPARGRSRTRLRRPRKPSRDEVWYLFWTAWCVGFGVFDLLAGAPITAAWQAVGACVWWRDYQQLRRGLRPAPWGLLEFAWIAGVIPLLVLGLP